MIRLTRIRKVHAPKKVVLDQVSLTMNKGEFLYVLGGTGAGKTSLLKLLALEDSPTSGELELFGYDLSKASEPTKSAIRGVIGYVPQQPLFMLNESVFDNVLISLTYGSKVRPSAESRQWIYDLLERFSLIHLRDTPLAKLSGGESQRVALVRALAKKPELLIADEPTGAQDIQNTWSVMEAINKLNLSNLTVVIATHDREIVRRLRKRCALLNQGKIQIEEAQICTR